MSSAEMEQRPLPALSPPSSSPPATDVPSHKSDWKTNKRTAGRRHPFLLVTLLLVFIGGGAVSWPYLQPYVSAVLPSRTADLSHLVTDTVKSGLLRVAVRVNGNLDSLRNVTLSCNVEGRTTIISIVPEGTFVKKGDLVCELDSSLLTESAQQQQIKVTQSDAAMRQAFENVEIQRTQNESDIAAAELAIQLAELDLRKFIEGEYLQQVNQIKGEITLAEEKLTRAEENYAFTQRLAKKGYRSQRDLEADRIAVTEAEIAVKVAREKLRVLEEYTYKRTEAELRANSEEYLRELERVKRKATAALAQYEADYKARKLTAEVEENQYTRLLAQIDACKLIAPQDGEVVYCNETGRRGNTEETISAGASVRERQEIAKLPDNSRMKVDVRIHESRIGLVKSGLPALIRVDAFPDRPLRGVVESVASVPSSTNFFNRDLKEYEAVVRITDDTADAALKPGLSASVEIIVEEARDVLQIPVQSLVNIGAKNYVFAVVDGEVSRREVVIGRSNDEYIEVRDGVLAGETVVMNPRSAFSEELTDLEEEYAQQARNEDESQSGDGQSKPPASDGAASRQQPPGSDNGTKPATPPAARPDFGTMDKDGDGFLAGSEIPERMKSFVGRIDSDGDGKISKAEFEFRPQRPAGGPPSN